MKTELKKITTKMGIDEYEMYQDIPKEEIGSTNKLFGISFEEFKSILEKYVYEETHINEHINACTTRYILYIDNKPVGEIGIRTTINDYWTNQGSQIYYKIRLSERKKGYGNLILQLGLKECKKLGMNKVRINCDDNNQASKKIIENNHGKVDIPHYQTKTGTSSSYIINLKDIE